jgi:hypothetical protein
MAGKAEEGSMTIKMNTSKKIFIACAIVSAVILSACSLFFSWEESEKSVLASPVKKPVNVTVSPSNNYQIGQKYSISWDSDCRGGEAIAWLSTASSSDSSMGILVPLVSFSAAPFGDQGQDDRIFFADPWKFDLSHNANKGKLIWTVPASLNLPQTFFKGKEGVYYIYTLADGRFALHKIVKEPVQMSVMPSNYYLRIDIKGKNGCTATGYSGKINIVNK